MKVYIAGDKPPFRGEIVLEGESPELVEPLIKGMTETNAIIGNIAVEQTQNRWKNLRECL